MIWLITNVYLVLPRPIRGNLNRVIRSSRTRTGFVPWSSKRLETKRAPVLENRSKALFQQPWSSTGMDIRARLPANSMAGSDSSLLFGLVADRKLGGVL